VFNLQSMNEFQFEILKWVLGILGSIIVIVLIPLIKFFYNKRIENKTKKEQHDLRVLRFMDNVEASHAEFKNDLSEVKAFSSETAMLLSATIETSQYAYFICDSHGMCITANDALLRLFNAKLSEMIGLGWLSFLHPDDLDRVKNNWKFSLDNKIVTVTDHYRIINKHLYDTKGDVDVIESVAYKALFQYDSDRLKRAVGTVWKVEGVSKNEQENERRNKALDCIIESFEQVKKTPTWVQIMNEVKMNYKVKK